MLYCPLVYNLVLIVSAACPLIEIRQLHIWSGKHYSSSSSGVTIIILLIKLSPSLRKVMRDLSSSDKLIKYLYSCYQDLVRSGDGQYRILSVCCLLGFSQHICIQRPNSHGCPESSSMFIVLLWNTRHSGWHRLGAPVKTIHVRCCSVLSKCRNRWERTNLERSVAGAKVLRETWLHRDVWHQSLNGFIFFFTWRECDMYVLQSKNNGTCFPAINLWNISHSLFICWWQGP